MSTQNLDGFKPLSKEEESHVLGGNPGKPDVCAPIAQQMAMVEAALNSTPMSDRHTPAYINMERELTVLTQTYKTCESSGHAN